MKIAVVCPGCSKSFLVTPQASACRTKCSQCGGAILVPAATNAAAPAANPKSSAGMPQAEQPTAPRQAAAPSQRPVGTNSSLSQSASRHAAARPAAPPSGGLDSLLAADARATPAVAPWAALQNKPAAAPVQESNNNVLLFSAIGAGVLMLLLVVGGIVFFAGGGGDDGKEVAQNTAPEAAPASMLSLPAPISPPASSTPIAPASTPAVVEPAKVEPVRPHVEPVAVGQETPPSAESAAAVTPSAAPAAATVLNLPELVEKVEPAVVRINATTEDGQVLGSGFVVDSQGTVVTNHHVIAGTREVTATFSDGKKVNVLGHLKVDATKDLAILRIDTTGLKLTPVPLAKELPRKGEQVVAFGAPIGLSFSATDGIVSAIREGKELNDFGAKLRAKLLQTSTPISSGNSGGPLVNTRGEVVGVNTAVLQVGQNLNFSVAVTEVRGMLDQIKADTQLVALMPAAPIESRKSSRSGGAVKDETPEDKLKKPPMPGEMSEWTFSGQKTKARIVELTSADSERRNPTKLTDKDFDKRGRYQLPKKIRVVFELESGQKRTVPDSTLERDNREAVQQFWKDHAYHYIQHRLVKRGGDIVEGMAEAGGDGDNLTASINMRNLSLLFILADITLPKKEADETITAINTVLEKYTTRTGNRQLTTLLNEIRQQVKGEMASENVIAGGALVGIFRSVLIDD